MLSDNPLQVGPEVERLMDVLQAKEVLRHHANKLLQEMVQLKDVEAEYAERVRNTCADINRREVEFRQIAALLGIDRTNTAVPLRPL